VESIRVSTQAGSCLAHIYLIRVEDTDSGKRGSLLGYDTELITLVKIITVQLQNLLPEVFVGASRKQEVSI
jgi:hypothetical protein